MNFKLSVLCCFSLYSTILADYQDGSTGQQFYHSTIRESDDEAGAFPSYQQSDILGRVWPAYPPWTDPMVQVQLSERAGKVSPSTFTRSSRSSSDREDALSKELDSALSDPDFVPEEEPVSEPQEDEEAVSLEDYPFTDSDSGQSAPLFDQIQRKLNLDEDGHMKRIAPREDDILALSADKELPVALGDDSIRERVRRSWSAMPASSVTRPHLIPSSLQPHVSTSPRPGSGTWNLHWNAELKKYHNVYNWNQLPISTVAGVARGSRVREASMTGVKGHRYRMAKRDPEPSPEYSETGLSLSITTPLQVLRDKVRMNEENKMKNKQRQKNRNTFRNSQRLKDLG